VNFFAHPLRKFAWTFELPNCWKVTLISPVTSPPLAEAPADAPGVVLVPLLPHAAKPTAAPNPAAVRMNSRLRTSTPSGPD
jgi:hypothetical protein